MNAVLFRIAITIVFLIFTAPPIFAHNKVVVIPLGGGAQPPQNVITVAKKGGDFTDPLAAMNSITDSSVSNPYLVVIAPGTYDIGTASLDVKPYVAVQGAGAQQTIIRSSALAQQDQYAVSLGEGSSLSSLRVFQDADVGTDVYGVVARGVGYSISDAEIEVSNPGFRGVGFSVLDENQPSNGVISHTRFVVPGNIDQGLGKIDSSVNDSRLKVLGSSFDVLASGTAIASLGFSGSSSLFVVQSTTINLLGDAGRGISNTDGDEQYYQNVVIQSSAENVRALSGSGSGFRPNFENSRARLTGSGSIGVATNNGRPKIRNSTIDARVGFTSTSNAAVFNPTFFVDNSVITATTAVLLDNGFALNINFNASRLDATTKLNSGTGTINAKCVSSSDRNYNPLPGDCS